MDTQNIQIDKDAILRSLKRLKRELDSLQMVLKLKGPKYFQRPIIIGIIMIFASYNYVYKSSGGSLEEISVKLESARATAEYAEDFKKLEEQLNTINQKLPKTKNPQEWLLNAIRKTLREEGIVPLSVSQPKEELKKNYRFVTITVNLRGTFQQMASWISRLERNKRLLYIKTLTLRKDTENIRENEITVQVLTVIRGAGK